MARNVMGLIMGLTVAFVIKWSVLSLNLRLFPLPEGINPQDVDAMKEYVKDLPAMAYIITLVSNMLCAFGGAYVAVKVAQTHHKQLAIGIGAFLMLLGLLNLITAPHPYWYMPLDLITYIPLAWLGYKMGT